MTKEKIQILVDGHKIEGYRVVTGKRKLYQAVYYNGKKEVDSSVYTPHQKFSTMMYFAKLILCNLATGRTI